MSSYANVLDLIGNTPLVRLKKFDAGRCELYAKLESQNPGGSIKDRIGLRMIEAAEHEGKLAPGGTIIEATAGNTGLGLALAAIHKGYRLRLVIPDKMSQEKVFHLRAMGVDIVMTRSDVGKGNAEYYQDLAKRIASATPGAFYIDQFSNPANPRTHETWTAPEIWDQMNQQLDAVVCGVGTGGTLTGIGRFMQRTAPHVQMILADPQGSVLADIVNTGTHGEAGSWLVEGIGEDFVPSNCDLGLVAKAYTISDAESLLTARDLLANEGLFAGSSAGTLVAAALRYCREQTKPKRVVTIVPDAGGQYLSKMVNDYWRMEQGILEREHEGDLSDLIARKHREHETVTISPDDMLMTALGRMKLYDFQQLPVLDGDKVVGIIDESDILMAVFGREDRFRDAVRSAMSARIETVSVNDDIDSLLPIFNKGHVAIVIDGEKFLGLITRYDMLTYLRRRAM